MSDPTGTATTDRLAAPDAALAGALPGPCREDLELLQGSIRELAAGARAGRPCPRTGSARCS